MLLAHSKNRTQTIYPYPHWPDTNYFQMDLTAILKVDPAVIETLESIAQEERVESIKKLAAEMVSNYTASGSFDLGKALMKRNY